MIFKIISLFLIFMAVLAMFGKLRAPQIAKKFGIKKPGKCPNCGSFKIGKGPCACEGKT